MKKAIMHLLSSSTASPPGLRVSGTLLPATQFSGGNSRTAVAAAAAAHSTLYEINREVLIPLTEWRDPVIPAAALPAAMTLGYAADNLTLRQSSKTFTSRSCQRRTFDVNGLSHVSQLALQNCLDLEKVVRWNHEHGIEFFRLSSKLFPWAGEYELEALPDFLEICEALNIAGYLARALGQRITSHPPHFIKLAATDDEIRRRSVANLEIQSRVFDLMGYEPSHWNKVRKKYIELE